MKLCVVDELRLGSAPDARAYFFLSCQEEVAKKKSRPQRRPAFAGCSALLRHNGRAAELGPSVLRQSSPFFPLRPALLDDAKGNRKTSRSSTANRFDSVRCAFPPPRAAPSNGGEPGVVGEDCLRGKAPSSAAPRCERAAQSTRRSRATLWARIFFGYFLFARKKKVRPRVRRGTQP